MMRPGRPDPDQTGTGQLADPLPQSVSALHHAWLARVRASWDGRAARWDESATADAASSDRLRDVERTIAALKLQPGDRLLDAGCGSGQWAIAFAERGMQVTAIDLSPEMICRARAHAAARGVVVTWLVGDLQHLPASIAVYQAIHARVVLQFVPDVGAALRTFRRILRPGGRLLASVPGALSPIYRGSWRRHLDDAPGELNWLLPWELDQLLEHAGWTILDSWGEWGRDLTGEPNQVAPQDGGTLDRRLQQATATTWSVVAR